MKKTGSTDISKSTHKIKNKNPNKYRKKGVASKLIEKFEENIKENNVKRIKLNAFPDNIPAINLYTKFGFKCYSSYYDKIIK